MGGGRGAQVRSGAASGGDRRGVEPGPHLARRGPVLVGGVADAVDDDVVAGRPGGEVLGPVVDDPVRAQARHQLAVGVAAHRGHGGTGLPGELHRSGADRTGGAVHQDGRAGPEGGLPEEAAGGEPAEHHRDGVLERHGPGLAGDGAVGADPGVLGVPAEGRAQHRDDLVSRGEPGDVAADCRNDAGDVHARHRPLGAEGADAGGGEQTRSAGHLPAAGTVVGGADRARVDPDQDVVRTDRRPRDLLHPDGVRSAEPAVHRGPHRTARSDGRAATADGRKPRTTRYTPSENSQTAMGAAARRAIGAARS